MPSPLTKVKPQKGFTLIELVLSVLILGVLSIILTPLFKTYFTLNESSKAREQLDINQKIASGLLEYASSTVSGDLPAPFTDSSANPQIKSAASNPYSMSPSSPTPLIVAKGVAPELIVKSDRASEVQGRALARVYQRSGYLLSYADLSERLNVASTATLAYHYGVVYNTNCPVSSSCNSANAVPDSSLVEGSPSSSNLMAADVSALTWTPSPDGDYSPVYLSTLPIQRDKLKATSETLFTISNALKQWFQSQASRQVAGAPFSSNPYPGSPSAATANLANDYCSFSWMSLSSNISQVLAPLGLAMPSQSSSELATTAWGTRIDYCKQYSPPGSSVSYQAALRISKFPQGDPVSSDSLTCAKSPTDATLGLCNIIIPVI